MGKDHQVVLLPLGGSQLINAEAELQLQEIRQISENLVALIDSERTDPDAVLSSERQGFVRACQNANVECRVLERRAIENYLSDRAIKKVKGTKYRALGSYEALNAINPAWSKSENWRIAREMTPEELNGTDLGEFLGSL